jgi:hypothetical protein
MHTQKMSCADVVVKVFLCIVLIAVYSYFDDFDMMGASTSVPTATPRATRILHQSPYPSPYPTSYLPYPVPEEDPRLQSKDSEFLFQLDAPSTAKMEEGEARNLDDLVSLDTHNHQDKKADETLEPPPAVPAPSDPVPRGFSIDGRPWGPIKLIKENWHGQWRKVPTPDNREFYVTVIDGIMRVRDYAPARRFIAPPTSSVLEIQPTGCPPCAPCPAVTAKIEPSPQVPQENTDTRDDARTWEDVD